MVCFHFYMKMHLLQILLQAIEDTKKLYTQLKNSLKDKLPSYCPDMSNNDYLDKPEWKNLPTPSKSNCSAKQEIVKNRNECRHI